MWPFKKTYPSSLSKIQIDLFGAINDGKVKAILPMINKYNVVVKSEFEKWAKVPIDIRGNEKWEKWYMNGIIGLADVYKQCGFNDYFDLLMGDGNKNPIATWEKLLAEANIALNENKPGVALVLLKPIVEEMKILRGSAVDKYLPICHGMIGAAYLKMGNIEGSLEETKMALEGCIHNDDKEGIEIYANSLKAIK